MEEYGRAGSLVEVVMDLVVLVVLVVVEKMMGRMGCLVMKKEVGDGIVVEYMK